MDKDKRNARIKKLQDRNRKLEEKRIRLQERNREEAAALQRLMTEAAAENWQILLDGKLDDIAPVTLLTIYGSLKERFEAKPQLDCEKA